MKGRDPEVDRRCYEEILKARIVCILQCDLEKFHLVQNIIKLILTARSNTRKVVSGF